MIRKRHQGASLERLLLAISFSVAVVAACGDGRVFVGDVKEGAPAPAFVDDAGPANASPRMCVSTACRAPNITCPDSEYVCDIDALTDNDHCGDCTTKCLGPPPPPGEENFGPAGAGWVCIEGRCQMVCDAYHVDCNGRADDGCESTITYDHDNCGGCGTKCKADEECAAGACVPTPPCPAPKKLCPPFPDRPEYRVCTDVLENDHHCGDCGIVCPPRPLDLPRPPFRMYYGCKEGECGHLKCIVDMLAEEAWGNCNNILEDGCEIDLLRDASNCGACGVVCPPGMACNMGSCGPPPPTSGCPAGLDACPSGLCVDFLRDPLHCGGCNIACPRPRVGQAGGVAVCRAGVCGLACDPDRADCNGSIADGCEAVLTKDPRHCGGCGHACDLAAGQPCQDGVCATAPCDPDGGGPTR